MDIEIQTRRQDDLADMPPEMRAELEVVSKSRRDFMKVTGMAAMGAVIAGCTAKEHLVNPLLKRPEGITPGVVYDYAGTCAGCASACGVVMKVRDGRPVKLEGDRANPLSRGGLCAKGQGQLWGLYDADRVKGAAKKDGEATWDELDAAVSAAVKGGGAWLVSGTVNGPAASAAIAAFCARTGARHVSYDACGSHAIAAAHKATHGAHVIPQYRFDNARVIVSLDADFLGTWISPMQFAAQWAQNRDLASGAREMSRHIQFEARYSLTGANADERFRLPNAQRGALLVDLANKLAGDKRFGEPGKHDVLPGDLDRIVNELKAARGHALVVSGSDNADQQKLVNWINHNLGAYGTTLELRNHSRQALGNDNDLADLLKAMEGGAVKTLILMGVNPVYDLPEGARFREWMGKVGTTVAVTTHLDETAAECAWVAGDHHALERWNDFEPVRGLYQLSQPAIRPLYKTRHGLQSLLKWAGEAAGNKDYREYLKTWWENNILGGLAWTSAVETGFVDGRASIVHNMPVMNEDAAKAADTGKVATGDFEIVAYESLNLGDGRHAGNGWLQENADPTTRVNWGNYVALSPHTMETMGVKEGDLVKLSAEVDGRQAGLTLPAVRQPGQAEKVAAVAVGYGRTRAGKLSHGMGTEELAFTDGAIGANAFPFVARGGKVVFGAVSAAGGSSKVARIQEHDSQEDRPLAKETTLSQWQKNPRSGNDEELPPKELTLWRKWEYKGHKWEMVVDLNKCMGCNACVVACNIENNIPVVGKKEVLNRREMHWLRIDIYYEDNDGSKYDGEQTKDENPAAIFQPIMCQHCENAPCETVCPVLATIHSEEGLNTQAYNRCIGTRYCANNCPYKVRRFNWFTYKHSDLTMNLALNPDVTIRSQGVMEKCSMCAQRLYEGKRMAALNNGGKLKDGAVTTACQSSCPTQAIVVGDGNDGDSRVAKLRQNPRNYQVLAEINTRPAVTYLAKVRNRAPRPVAEKKAAHSHDH
ncbi:MAG: 4Fe-4S dicluster domain-containing protein [Planctomycetes bacterium]|nr:4Fe-4S dicluster domain-containing protein [Planctomycetota bacterium]